MCLEYLKISSQLVEWNDQGSEEITWFDKKDGKLYYAGPWSKFKQFGVQSEYTEKSYKIVE